MQVPDVKEQCAPVGLEPIRYTGVTDEPFLGFPFHQHRQLEEIDRGQLERLGSGDALPVRLGGPVAIALEAAIPD